MSGECYSPHDGQTIKVIMKNKSAHLPHTTQKLNAINGEIIEISGSDNEIVSSQSKASQLQKYLENMKQMSTDRKAAKISKRDKFISKSMKSGLAGVSNGSSISMKRPSPVKMYRQNSNAISTDKTSAPLNTVNNILASLAKSIPPDFVHGLKSSQPPLLHGVDKVKINSKSKHTLASTKSKPKAKFKTKKSRSTVVAASSSLSIKKAKKAPRKVVDQIKQSVPVQENKCPTKTSYLPRNPQQAKPQNQDLVEIYHNRAVQEVRSSESDLPKKREEVPPLDIKSSEPNKTQTQMVPYIFKSYAMPTISSRMKQVAKLYMKSLNVKTIPFCAVRSTSPSHNIGLNIQLVMSMVKKKIKTVHLSPTLAYNIGLAAEKWETSVTPISTYASQIYSQCPLTKSTVNYQHLQEVAKTIPEETIEEVEEVESPDTQSVFITGPSGDVKVKNRKRTVWSVSCDDDKKCTCAPSKGTEFQQILNKFNSGPASISKLSKATEQQTSANSVATHNEKKLRDMLNRLHSEFERMNRTYEELAKQSQTVADAETLKKIETLDKELSGKEDEIEMVMALYEEVIALKKQVKVLKERASKESIVPKNQPAKNSVSNNVATASLLNNLLHRIQHFQSHYKR